MRKLIVMEIQATGRRLEEEGGLSASFTEYMKPDWTYGIDSDSLLDRVTHHARRSQLQQILYHNSF